MIDNVKVKNRRIQFEHYSNTAASTCTLDCLIDNYQCLHERKKRRKAVDKKNLRKKKNGTVDPSTAFIYHSVDMMFALTSLFWRRS